MRNLEKKLVNIYKDVFYFVFSKVNDEDIAQDLTQSVMEIVISKINTLRKEESFKSWVMQIANNKVNAYYKEVQKINKVFKNSYNSDEDFTNGFLEVQDVKVDILQEIISIEDSINIMTALNNIDQKYQEVIRLNRICGYNLIEVAEILNVNINTVRTWSARGLIKLKEEFNKLNTGESNEKS